MDAIRFGLSIRALRRRRGWRQADLAARAGVSRSLVQRAERGGAARMTLATLVGIAAPLGARVDLRVLWHGEALDRLLDAGHAAIVEIVARELLAAGWLVRTEVAFNEAGERGSIDLLACHPATGALVVIEVKSTLPDLQATLVALDRKTRLARRIAAGIGWRATSVSTVLVLPDDRTSRRRVERHAATIDAQLPARSVAIRRWIRDPAGAVAGVRFVSVRAGAASRDRVARRVGSRHPPRE